MRGDKDLNDFKFGTFVGRFWSDGTTSMAVKGLNIDYKMYFVLERCRIITVFSFVKDCFETYKCRPMLKIIFFCFCFVDIM